MLAANPEFDPVQAGDVRDRPAVRARRDRAAGSASGSRRACGDLFNVSYEILLQIFERYFAHTEETDEQLGTLADATVALMLRVLRPLGNLITTLPVGPEFPGMNAGPSFELFYENDYLMPHREAAWALLEERVREAANFCGLIQEIAPESVAGELAPVEQALDRRRRLARRPVRRVGGEEQVRGQPDAGAGCDRRTGGEGAVQTGRLAGARGRLRRRKRPPGRSAWSRCSARRMPR